MYLNYIMITLLYFKRNLARMLYWGAQGVQRDVIAALEYYRLGAESGEPAAIYDYGIVLLKVCYLNFHIASQVLLCHSNYVAD